MEEVKIVNLPMNIQEEMDRQIAALSGRLNAPTGNKIRISQDKVFTFPDGQTTDEHWQAVIVDFVARNDYYENGYDSSDITPPNCFAIGTERTILVPSQNAPDRQADACTSCPQNQWGTGARGKGKACKNSTLLAVLPPDADADHPIWLLQVSPTALKFFDDYVRSLARQLRTMPVGVVTTIGFDPNETYPSLRFGRPSPNERVGEFMARQAEAKEILTAEPDVTGFGQEKSKKRR